MKKKVVVVGGGISGILTAILLAEYYDVTLVEKEATLGGLLNSIYPFGVDYPFDKGTHLLAQTGNKELDHLLYDGLNVDVFDYLKSGNFFHSLFETSSYITDQDLENRQAKFEKFIDYKRNFKNNQKFQNNRQELIVKYGEDYSKELLIPSVEKFFRSPSNELSVRSHELFGLSRVLVGNAEKTRELKKEQMFDDIIAFHSYKEGLSSRKSMYPRKGGVGIWVSFLEKKLEYNNVKIIKNASVENILFDEKKVKSITINDEKIDFDALYWTISPFILIKLLGIPFNFSKPPQRLTTYTSHFLIEDDYLTYLYYLQNYNTSLDSFRVTLYDNYNKTDLPYKRITVETMYKQTNLDLDSIKDKAFQELKQMKIIADDVQPVKSFIQVFPNTFPILTPKFVENSKLQVNTIQESFDNIIFLGKSRGDIWFMNDVLLDVYNTIRN